MKTFNTAGICIPSKHYMADLSEKVQGIRRMVEDGKYFPFSRPRQYGKTTVLAAVDQALSQDYYLASVDFLNYGEDAFCDSDSFSRRLSSDLYSQFTLRMDQDHGGLRDAIQKLGEVPNDADGSLRMLTMFNCIREICGSADKPVVLLIDGVDLAVHHLVFLDFLAALRSQYIKREKYERYKTFQSVIVTGVTDVRYLDDQILSTGKEYGPWNIGSDFTIDMSLSETGIRGMLDEYEADRHTGMDTAEIAKVIRAYTNGYPFLVSRICQLMDERAAGGHDSFANVWTEEGVNGAVKQILTEKNTLFDSLMGKLREDEHLRNQFKRILQEGGLVYIPGNRVQQQLMADGFIVKSCNVNGRNTVAVANRIFEMRFYEFYFGEVVSGG